MNKRLTVIVLLCLPSFVFCQIKGDSIQLKRSWDTYSYYHKGMKTNWNQINELMKPNEAASIEFAKAKKYRFWSTSLGVVGGALMGWPVGKAIAGDDMNWGTFLSGATLVVVSIPINRKSNKHILKSVNLYNKSVAKYSP